jgi:WD40 repeat protein
MARLMNQTRSIQLASAAAAALLSVSPLFAADKTNYQDHVLPIFRDSCLNCHNPDKKKAGLDLSTYSTAIAGSTNGAVLNSGDPDGSMLYKAVTHAEEPTMPPKKDKLPEKELAVIKAWIAGGLLETANGKAVVSAKPKIDMTVSAGSLKKPDGPPLMPKDLLPEPVIRSDRQWAVSCMATSPWSPVVAIGGQHQILLFNSSSLDLLGVVPYTDGAPQVVQFSKSGRVLLIGGGVAGKSGKVALWDLSTGAKLTDVGEEFDSVLAADISPDQASVALGGPTKAFKIYSTRDGALMHVTKKHTDWVTACAYSGDGVLLASADRAGGLFVWEAKNGNEFYNLAGHKAGVTSVAFRDDSNFLASASEDGTVKLWDMQSGKEAKTWPAHAGGVLSVAFTHDGRLVTAGRDKMVKIWTADGTQVRQFDAFNDIALHATFDADGKRVIAGDWTGELRVWDAGDGKLLGNLTSNPAPLSERLMAAEKRIADLTPTIEKVNADAAAAQTAADKAVADQKAAETALAAAKAVIADATAKSKSADEAVQAAKNASKAAEASLAEKQTAATQANKARDLATAAVQTAREKLKAVQETVTAKQSALDDAKKALAAARAEAEKKSDDEKLAMAAKDMKTAADKASDELAAAKAKIDVKTAAVKSAEDEAAKAQTHAAHADERLAAVKKTIADKLAEADKLRTARKDAEAAIPKAKADADASAKTLAAAPERIKAAQTQATAAKAVADTAIQQLAAAKQEVTRLKIGQFYLNVYTAKQELTARQAELDQLTAAAKAAQTDADNSAAAIAAAKKVMADPGAAQKELETALEKARWNLASSNNAAQAAQATFDQKQALLTQAGELSQKLAAQSQKSPDDKSLADAAGKAKATTDSLSPGIDAAKQDAASKSEAAKSAAKAVETAQTALEKYKAELASNPKKIESLKHAAETALAEIPKKKAAAEQAAKAVAAAKAKFEQLNAEYQKKSQEAGVNSPGAVSKG